MDEPVKLPFRPGKLALEGIQLLHAKVTRNHSGSDDHVTWHVTVLQPPADEEPLPFLVVADLHAVKNGLFVGAIHVSPVTLPPRHPVETVDPGALREVVITLFGEILWDAAATTVGQLGAMARESVDLPQEMPLPTVHDGSDPCEQDDADPEQDD